MIITFELPDEHAACIERYIKTQQRVSVDEVTGAPVVTYPHEDAEEFILDNIGNLIHSVLQQYPTQAMRTQMAQAKAISDAVKAAAKPKKVKV